jgi:hypothetical protein
MNDLSLPDQIIRKLETTEQLIAGGQARGRRNTICVSTMAACRPSRMNTIAQRDGIVRFCMGYVLPAQPVIGCSPAYDLRQPSNAHDQKRVVASAKIPGSAPVFCIWVLGGLCSLPIPRTILRTPVLILTISFARAPLFSCLFRCLWASRLCINNGLIVVFNKHRAIFNLLTWIFAQNLIYCSKDGRVVRKLFGGVRQPLLVLQIPRLGL